MWWNPERSGKGLSNVHGGEMKPIIFECDLWLVGIGCIAILSAIIYVLITEPKE